MQNLTLLLGSLIFILYNGKIVSGIQVDIQPSTTRCIGQELDQEDTASFSFTAIKLHEDSTDHQVFAIVSDPDDSNLFQEPLEVGGPQKEFILSVEKRGQHHMCFELAGGERPVRVQFKIDYRNRGNQLHSPSKKVDKENIPTLENQLKMAEASLHLISNEIDFARRQESTLREAGETTNSRIQWLSILSILVLLTVSLWQILYLRSFFASKKLL